MRFRSEQHVRRQRDFRRLRENGRRLECGGFAFWHCKRAGADDAAAGVLPEIVRLAVVASRAAVGDAVRRARAKRRLREVFRRNQRLVPAGHDVMLVAKRPLNDTAFPAIEQKFADACRRAFGGAGKAES